MTSYLVLFRFTDKGIANVGDSPDRAEGFRKQVTDAGGSVRFFCWTLGEYDGALFLDAPDEATAAALVLGVAKQTNVRTHMLRAFEEDDFRAILAKTP